MPLPIKFQGQTFGHYQIAQRSGAIAATPSALDDWARIRWVPSISNARLVLIRLRIGITVITAITTAVQHVYSAAIARSYSVDHDTAITNISMVNQNGAVHSRNMASSLMGATGPGICTTAPMTGETSVLATPFAIVTLPNPSPTLGASAVTNQVGCATDMVDLYNWATVGGYPPCLKTGEGIVVQTVLAGHATGTIAFHTEWTWAECINPFGDD